MISLAPHDDATAARLAQALSQVEARFAAELLSDLDCVSDLVAHVERYRGKMLRPTLVLVSALAASPQREAIGEPHLVLASVVEMVHMATLVHDDILDEADLRRRGAAINRLAGNEAAVMLGDYLISHAYHLCSSLDADRVADVNISRLIAQATNTVCEGELLQLANRNNWAMDERTYFEIIRRKTASLCGVCCHASAVLDGQDRRVCRALHDFGEKLGMAFQIIDDVLDLAGDPRTVGKTLGRDLEKGKLTLPLIRHLAAADEQEQTRMRAQLETLAGLEAGAPEAMRQVAQLREQVTAGPALDDARQCAAGLVERAQAGIREHLSSSPARTLLLDMADAVLSRRL